jgi:hypothetical protein
LYTVVRPGFWMDYLRASGVGFDCHGPSLDAAICLFECVIPNRRISAG